MASSVDRKDHFKNCNPDSEWKAGLEHAEKIGLGSSDYELVPVCIESV